MKSIFSMLVIICTAVYAVQKGRLVAEWDFGKRTDADVAGKFTGGKVRGKSTIVDGWLTMTGGYDDKAEGFATSEKPVPELMPTGGFRFEVVAKVRGEHNGDGTYTILDSKYLRGTGKGNSVDNNRGFAWILLASKTDPRSFTLYAQLGCDGVTHVVTSDKLTLEPDREYKFEAEYDGVTSLRFFLNGKDCGGRSFEGGPIVAPIRPLVIGDRFGSLQHRFNGSIKSVKLYEFPAKTIKLFPVNRMAYVRGEKVTEFGMGIWNYSDKMATFEMKWYLDGDLISSPKITTVPKSFGWVRIGRRETRITWNVGSVHTLKAVGRVVQFFAIDEKTGNMTFEKIDESKGEITDEITCKFVVGPMPPPDSFPVVIWNAGECNPGIDTWVEYGVTHDLLAVDKYGLDARDRAIVEVEANALLDKYTAKGVKLAGYFTYAHNGAAIKKYPRYNALGQPVVKNIEASNPEYQKDAEEVARKTAGILAGHPGFGALLINSEVRDSSMPSFGQFEPAAFEKFAGYPIPPSAVGKVYDNYRNVDGFPLSRIIPDDDRILNYYKWFWKEGDGWNKVHSIVHDEFHKKIDGDFWTFFDPAVRTPPIWGSGGSVDVLNQWTYAYPDPIRASVATDELFAMAKGRLGQKVMSMTQIICYRNQTAPIGEHPENEPAWVKDSPKGPYISIPPDSLKASIWSIISRPVQGIMFHGAGSCWGKPGDKGYVTTNPETKEMFKKVINGVVKPLGPTLKRIPDRPHEVAVLESFASTIYAQRGTWGWSGRWISDAHLMLQWARLSPSVIYEEEILRDGFGSLKVLCLVDCDVLTEGVLQKILEFQSNGGIVIADENVSPRIVADISISSMQRTNDPKADKAKLQALAEEVRRKLGSAYAPYSDSDNTDIITRVRSYRNADYFFILNDKRDYGDYLGPWKRTMEKGLPNSGIATLRRNDVKAVYDLVEHKPARFKTTAGGVLIPQVFDSNDGRLLLVMDDAIEKVKCKAEVPNYRKDTLLDKMTKTVTNVNPQPVKLEVQVLGSKGRPVAALIPINISIYDPDGNLLDGSGAACAVDGEFSYEFLTTPHAGVWTVKVTELASGKQDAVKFKIWR